jgi:hypothetical protein
VLASEACPAACDACDGPELYTDINLNPCAPNGEPAPLRADLPNLPCIEAGAQSGGDVTKGAVGLYEGALDPVPDYSAAGMCTVNVHWHIGAEHRSEGEYDETYAFEHRRLASVDTAVYEPTLKGSKRRLAGGRVGHMARQAKEMHDSSDPLVANEYDWKFCQDMHVGLTYEFHWPHSSLGACQTEWQYQYHFLDGVLCGATMAGLDIETAVDALVTRAHNIGVEGQVFTIVNSDDPSSSDYLRPTWDSMNSWDRELATDIAYYQGSTTGDAADNDQECRGTGGVVTWHVDRKAHLLEAATMDNLCRLMLVIPSDDMSPDVAPHGARETTTPELSDTPVDDPYVRA